MTGTVSTVFVAVTMLQVHDAARDEWRDAIDVRWTRFLARCGLQPLYLPNAAAVAARLLDAVRPAGVVLTGGGSCSALSGKVDARDDTETVALSWADACGRPVVGVCRGMQVMLSRAGAALAPVVGHVGRAHEVLVDGVSRSVNSYHEYGFTTVPEGYAVQARAEDGVLEAAFHRERRHRAVMWHPERETEPHEADLAMFRSLFGAIN